MDIVTRIAKGQLRALKELYDIYGKMMFAAALTVCCNNIDADETVNRVLTKIWKHAEVTAGVRDPDAWLFALARRAAEDLVANADLPFSPAAIPAADEFCRVYDRDEFYYLIRDLSEIEQAIVIYRFVRRFDLDAIAETMCKPFDAVASAYYVALEKIKKKRDKQLF